jgi:serine protease Do
VMRDKKKITLNAKLEALPEGALASTTPGSPMPKGGGAASELIAGVTAQNMSPALAEKYGIAKGVEGVVVTEVDPDSSAAAVGLKDGDVIQAINRHPVKDIAEAKDHVKGNKQTVLLKVHRKGDTMLFVIRD